LDGTAARLIEGDAQGKAGRMDFGTHQAIQAVRRMEFVFR
jgi:hypothetical protein